MNCKPGDIAIIVRSKFAPQLLGRIVEVLHAAPSEGGFCLPNGQRHVSLQGGLRHYWVCKFQSPIEAPGEFMPITTVYAPAPDDCLRPIRDQPGEDETLRIAGLPVKEFA